MDNEHLALPEGVELRPLLGFEGKYSAGSDGFIYTHIYKYNYPAIYRLGAYSGSQKYLYVKLQRNGKRYQRAIHVWVCLAFHGPKPTLNHQVRHLDGNVYNNKPTNLRWGTGLENAADRVIHGTQIKGLQIHSAKLTEELAFEIRNLYGLGGITQQKLAEKYGVGQSTISSLLLRKTWKHI